MAPSLTIALGDRRDFICSLWLTIAVEGAQNGKHRHLRRYFFQRWSEAPQTLKHTAQSVNTATATNGTPPVQTQTIAEKIAGQLPRFFVFQTEEQP